MGVSGEFSNGCLLSFHPYLVIELPSNIDLILARFVELGHLCSVV